MRAYQHGSTCWGKRAASADGAGVAQMGAAAANAARRVVASLRQAEASSGRYAAGTLLLAQDPSDLNRSRFPAKRPALAQTLLPRLHAVHETLGGQAPTPGCERLPPVAALPS